MKQNMSHNIYKNIKTNTGKYQHLKKRTNSFSFKNAKSVLTVKE